MGDDAAAEPWVAGHVPPSGRAFHIGFVPEARLTALSLCGVGLIAPTSSGVGFAAARDLLTSSGYPPCSRCLQLVTFRAGASPSAEGKDWFFGGTAQQAMHVTFRFEHGDGMTGVGTFCGSPAVDLHHPFGRSVEFDSLGELIDYLGTESDSANLLCLKCRKALDHRWGERG